MVEVKLVEVVHEVLHELIPVDAVGSESNGAGLELVAGPLIGLRASAESDLAFAGAVDNDLSKHHGLSARMLADDAVDVIAGADNVSDHAVQHKLAASLGERRSYIR